MVFTHDTECSLRAAVTLVNTTDPETLDTVEALEEFVGTFGYTGRYERSRAELDEVRALREPLRRLLTAPRDEAVDIVNDLLSSANAVPQLVRHGSHDWHIHAVPNDAPLAVRIQIEAAMGMVDVIRSDETSRLSVCADDSCDDVVLDLSRNRRKRYCSTTCANRNAVAAYRSRQH
jgi:predicted RNA-binding Zn ribbon-like protein